MTKPAGKQELLEYLKVARDLELALMKLHHVKDGAEEELCVLRNKSYPSFSLPYPSIKKRVPDKTLEIAKAAAIVGAIVGIIAAWNTNWLSATAASSDSLGAPIYWFVLFLFAAPFCAAIFAAIGAIVGAILGAILTAIAQSELEKQNKVYESKNQAAEKLWREETRVAKSKDAAALHEFEQDTDILDELIDSMEQILEAHYDDGPIYRKYQNLPAVCQLYEYFDSGRFSELGEAYNQYELEVRLDKIIDNQEMAFELLQQIRDNQYILYRSLQEIKASIDTVNWKLSQCVERLDSIAYSQEVTSICMQQTALATTLLSQIELYKNRHDLPFAFSVLEGYLLAVNARLLGRKKSLNSQHLKE